MARIGERASLTVMREAPPGLYLDAGEDLGEVLLPNREVPKETLLGSKLDVFLYRDSEDRPVATLKRPRAMPGEFAYLEVVESTNVGNFLDWGLQKDLLLPFREQKDVCEVGRSYVVHIYIDPNTDRVVASRRLNRFFTPQPPEYQTGQEVELLLYGKTDLGYKAVINNESSGVLYADSVFRRLHAGERTVGYIDKVRPDGKIDLTLYPPTQDQVKSLEKEILSELSRRKGRWELCDSSPPEDIYRIFGVSKKVFKRATGSLYKQRKILIHKDGIEALEP